MRRVLCVWLPRWPVQRLVSERPELKEQAVVLFAEAARGLQVIGCSLRASQWGVFPGMPLAEAKGLAYGTARSASQAVLITELAVPHRDREALEDLALNCQTYAPLVGLEETDAPECLLLEITGCAPHFHGEEALARQLHQELQAHSYEARIGVTDTVGSAWAAAHFATSSTVPIQIVPSGQQREYIRRLPIAALRLQPQILEILDKLDIRVIQQVERLPRTALPSRFGKELQQRLDQAWGVAYEPVLPIRPREPISATWNFEIPVTDQSVLELVSRELLTEVLLELQPRRFGILELQTVYRGPLDAFDFTLRMIQPTADPRHLWSVFQLEWERQKKGFEKSRQVPRCLSEGVSSVRLIVVNSALLRIRQQTLFEVESGKREKQAFSQLIERLGGRLGKPAVLRSRPVPDPQPELSCELLEWPDSGMHDPDVPSSDWQNLITRSRPLRLLPHPEPLQVLAMLPDGPPHRIWRAGQLREITRVWGPERITTGWWREQGISRDYYRIEVEEGQQFWIFRCLITGNWLLQGVYE